MPTPCLDDSLQRKIGDLYTQGKSTRDIAGMLRLSETTVRKYGRGVKAEPDADPVETAEQRRARTRELAAEREQLEAVAGERSFRNFLSGLFSQIPPFPPCKPPKAPPARAGKVKRFPLLHLSDWHFEEIVRPEAVMGLNSYDMATAGRRVYRVVQAFRDWHRDQTRFAMPELTVALNGDFLTGTLHGLERHSSAPNVVRATLACGRLVAQGLRDLAADFPKVKVIGTVGNHGRLPDDKKVPTKDPTRSFDYMAYAIARELLRDIKHVEFVLPESYGAVYEVAGHSCFQGHGNFVKQQMGIVGYGMRRFVSNLAANMGAAGHSLRYAFFGHFHQASAAEFAGVTAFIGPSLIGTQEYGFLSGGSINRPAQQAFVFDPDLGHTSTETIYGDGPGYEGTYEVDL